MYRENSCLRLLFHKTERTIGGRKRPRAHAKHVTCHRRCAVDFANILAENWSRVQIPAARPNSSETYRLLTFLAALSFWKNPTLECPMGADTTTAFHNPHNTRKSLRLSAAARQFVVTISRGRSASRRL